MRRVAIFGGGIAGLSAAHELARFRPDIEVDVYEAEPAPGGKASSQIARRDMVVGGPMMMSPAGHAELPGEHGFRFFPHFYANVLRTMEEIPFGVGTSCKDNLVGVGHGGVAKPGPGLVQMQRLNVDPAVPPGPEMIRALRQMFTRAGMSDGDLARYTLAQLRFLTSCQRRRDEVYDDLTWWDFVGADHMTPEGQRLIDSITSTMVAMRARSGSARTIGAITLQLAFDFRRTGERMDAALGGPTTRMWLEPWMDLLLSRGVRFHPGRRVRGLVLDGGHVAHALMEGGDRVEADHYLMAVPLDVMQALIDDPLAEADEQLANLLTPRMKQASAWMVGAQFYLPERFPFEDDFKGHLFYPEADWALTSIFQGWFWEQRLGRIEHHFGDGTVKEILSVDISDWDRVSDTTGKTAAQCGSADEVLDEVWRQLRVGLHREGWRLPEPIHRHLDRNVFWRDDGRGPLPVNPQPLLVHPPGSWALRPEPTSAIDNLYLASDYVRSSTDLATMEGANETARMASRAIVDREGLDAEEIEVFPLTEGDTFEWARRLDDLAYSTRGALGGVLDDVLDGADDLLERFTGHDLDSLLAKLTGR